MIKINLLPQELRKKMNAMRILSPLVILAAVLFLLATFFFYGDYFRARSVYKSVKKEWVRVNPAMAILNGKVYPNGGGREERDSR
ncbi:MAG: hypothetical protein WC484_00805 [Candidatus Omnitrophota bacterium]